MKALSFHQPRAEQIVRGEKTVDVRTWRTTYRGPLAIHATAQRRDARCRALGFDPDALAYGALLGTVALMDVHPLDAEGYAALQGQHRLDAPYPGAPCFAWVFERPARLAEPLPYRGRMRLFNVKLEAAPSPPATPAPPATPPHRPDPERPFALHAIPEEGNGYRIALTQWGPAGGAPMTRPSDAGALWSIDVGGDALRAVTDHVLAALRANGYRATALARAVGSDRPFYLNELTGLRLALILIAVKPLARHDRIEAIGLGIQTMSAEEAYYWFSKCTAGDDALRAQKALRVLLADE